MCIGKNEEQQRSRNFSKTKKKVLTFDKIGKQMERNGQQSKVASRNNRGYGMTEWRGRRVNGKKKDIRKRRFNQVNIKANDKWLQINGAYADDRVIGGAVNHRLTAS